MAGAGPTGGRSGFAERSGFPEYAELARHLDELYRSGERAAERARRSREEIGAAITGLDHHLALQRQRLARLARDIGESPPDGVGAVPAPYPPPPPPPGAGPPPPPPHAGPPPPPHAAPVQPELPPGPARLALPATTTAPATGAGQWAVPPPRSGYDGPAPATVGSAARTHGGPGPTGGGPTAPGTAVDPYRELELARRAVDAADAAATRAEELAQRPMLLPGWSPMARAIAVYAGCAGAVMVVQLVLLRVLTGLDEFGRVAWSCAGLPAVAFFTGYLLLHLLGRPKVGTAPTIYPRLGFLICFLAGALAPCLTLISWAAAGPAGFR